MQPRLARSFVVLALITSLAACASAKPSAAGATAPSDTPSAREWEPWPPAETPKPARAEVASDPANVVRLVPKDGGWRLGELLDSVSRTTGISILYDSADATFEQTKVYLSGVHVIEEDQLFDWLQAVLSYRKLVVVALGPKSADGKQQWLVRDQADPMRSCPPVLAPAAK